MVRKKKHVFSKTAKFHGLWTWLFCEKRRIAIFQNLDTFTLIDENVMQSFIGNCPVIVELMASKCGDLPVEYNSSPLHYLIDSVEESSCKFLFLITFKHTISVRTFIHHEQCNQQLF
ncbi:hypothetical protein Tsp_10504 [Trichinella spiralis]|uniref:hypothetical protein n=1 Tax=Trichinella spiralis TaxID=6334 RepID=UPI0001EFD146|nr:hypothetical protein Tsp_10504 [Trichinella spiralis]